MKTTVFALCFVLGLRLASAIHGSDLPRSDAELDTWLCDHSPKYKQMAEKVRSDYSYRIEAATEFPLGNVREDRNGIVIELNPNIPQPRRATILIWEMANAFQRPTFAEISRRAHSGAISSHREYGLRMEIVEFHSHQLHRDVLVELSEAGVKITEDYLYFLNPNLKSLDQYRIPSVHDYIEAQAKSGHTRHYEKWYFHAIGATPPPTQKDHDDH